jgi:hypothetical protein
MVWRITTEIRQTPLRNKAKSETQKMVVKNNNADSKLEIADNNFIPAFFTQGT